MDLFFPFVEISQLIDLLNQDDPKLEELLDLECVVSELKTSNKRLLSFLCKPEIFDSLVSYVTKGSADKYYNILQSRKDHKTNKFPFVACDILSAENDVIAHYFLGLITDPTGVPVDPEAKTKVPLWKQLHIGLLSGRKSSSTHENSQGSDKASSNTGTTASHEVPILKFLKFLDLPAVLNPTLSGYFAKVLRNIIYFKPQPASKLLFETYFDYLLKINTHLYSDSLQELFSIIIKLDVSHFAANGKEYYISQRHQLVKQVISNIFERPPDPHVSPYNINLLLNSANLLSGLISSYKSFTNGEIIISPIIQHEILEKIFKKLVDIHFVPVLAPLVKQLCEHYIAKYALPENPSVLELPFSCDYIIKTQVPNCEAFASEVVKSISAINNIMKIENKEFNPQAVAFQYGMSMFPFGQDRVKLVELVYFFLRLQNENVDKEIKSTELLCTLLGLFTKNPWNDILHMTLLRIFSFIVLFGSDMLKRVLFEQAKVLEYIPQAYTESYFQINSKLKGRVQKGYMSYLNALANNIDKSRDQVILNYCAQSQEWRSFKYTILNEANRKNDINFGGNETPKLRFPCPNFPKAILARHGSFDMQEIVKEGAIETLSGLNDPNIITDKSAEETKIDLEAMKIQEEPKSCKFLNLFKSECRKEEDVVSPTYAGDFSDQDIKEREACEIKFPQSVDIKFGRSNSNTVESLQDDLFEMIIEKPLRRTSSPKLENSKLIAKNIDDDELDFLL